MAAQPDLPPRAARADAIAEEMTRPTGAVARRPGDGWQLADPWPMSPSMVRKLHGLIRAMCPPEPVVPDLEPRIEVQIRRMLPYMQPLIARAFFVALRVLDLAPIWRLKRARRLQDLDHDEACAILDGISHAHLGPLSDMVAAARAAILGPYYDLDEVHAHLGYQPAAFMRSRVALRQRLLAGGAPRAEDHIGPYSEHLTAPIPDLRETPR